MAWRVVGAAGGGVAGAAGGGAVEGGVVGGAGNGVVGAAGSGEGDAMAVWVLGATGGAEGA
jgi:hypothetical protein